MTWMKLIAPGTPVEVKFSAGEHSALLDLAQGVDKELLKRLRHSPSGKVIRFSLTEWEQLATQISRAARKVGEAKARKQLTKALDKIVRVLETYTDEDDDGQTELLSNKLIDGGTPLELLSELFGNSPNAGPNLSIDDAMADVCLTKAQREILLSMDTVSGDIHKMLHSAGEGEQTLRFNPRQTIVLGLAISEEMAASIPVARQVQLEEIVERLGQGMLEIPGMPEALGPSRLVHHVATVPSVCFRAKIELEGSRPTIWRRIEIADCSLLELHEAIQDAMGWANCHMHAFQIGKQLYADPDLENAIDDATVSLSELFDEGVKKFRYWYDFGDDWWHTIKLEKQVEPDPNASYPRCTAGARACPPDDCGGIWGYEEMLAALGDPQHERHEEFREWCEEDFDAGQFSIDEANARLSAPR